MNIQRHTWVLQLATLAAVTWLTPTPVRGELLGTASWSGRASAPGPYVGISFDVGYVAGPRARLFEHLTFGTHSVGLTFEASGYTEADIMNVFLQLIDGAEQAACLTIHGENSSVSLCDSEQRTFGLGQTDFEGEVPLRVTMDILRLDFSDDEVDFEITIRVHDDHPVIGPCAVQLNEPVPEALLDNGCANFSDARTWDFSWQACPGADAYQLRVRGAEASVDMIDVTLNDTEYQDSSNSYIAEGLRHGLTWRVRARVDGEWGDWSERQFDVEPPGTDCPAAAERRSWGSLKARY